MTTLSAEQLGRDVAAAGLVMAATSSTLLRYAILPDPNPMQVSAQNARLTLVISNPGSQVVTCTRIEVTLPVGTTWRVSNAAGDVVIEPLGKVDPNGPKEGYRLVPTGDYTLRAAGYWGPATKTLHLT